MNDESLDWKNGVWLSVVSACIGELDRSVLAAWIEFVGGRDVVIHFQVDRLTPKILDDTRDIADEVIPLMDTSELGSVTRQVQLEPPEMSLDNISNFRWVYRLKQDS